MPDKSAVAVRLERIRRQIRHGTYETTERIVRTVGHLMWIIRDDSAVRDQRAIDELSEARHG